jgi:N-acetylneuraminic acid mutarotase
MEQLESSVINDLGYLRAWQIEPSKLLQARFIANSFALNNRLYILGEHNGAKRLKSVEFTKILRNGRVSSWSKTTALNIPRSAAATAVSGNYIYVLGGMGNSQALNSVEIATAPKNGQLGQVTNFE